MSRNWYLHKFQAELSGRDFLILDTETTGLYNAEICQIAIVSSTGETLLDTLVKPISPIPPDATRIHHITDQHVANFPGWSQVQETVADILRGRQLVIYNSDYDTKTMNSAAAHAGVKPIWNTANGIYCAMRAFAVVYGVFDRGKQDYRWQSLTTAANFSRVPVVNAHSALGDCLTTLNVVRTMLAKVEAK